MPPTPSRCSLGPSSCPGETITRLQRISLVWRNQMRDTVRIFNNGHLLYVGLSIVGLFLLPRSSASSFHRRLLWASVVTYASLNVLKDPAVLPNIFLYVKEELFYAPIACLLTALPLAALWRQPRWCALAWALLFSLLCLAVRDQLLDASTL